MSAILIIVLVVAVLVVFVLATQRSGPRVTTIEHRRDEIDKPEDRD